MCARRFRETADRHAAAALTHEELAAHWKATGDPERAALEGRNAELERMAAQLERDRAALTERREARSERSGEAEVRPLVTSEVEILRAVEILRGTAYDFRLEATTDVVALFGTDVLVAALERLDNEIEPRPRRAEAARRS
jgi:hypothetical protein